MPHPSFAAAALGCALLATTFVPPAAHAQSAPPRAATRDELRACMDSEDNLKAKRADLEARAQRNSDDAAAINKDGAALKEEQQHAEESTLPMARDRFERRVRQYQARIAAAKESEAGVRTGMEDLKKAIDEHNTRCNGISFRPEDKAAILQERAAKGK
jgi:chromosome segregation ATPase